MYELTEDRLTIILAMPGAPRPSGVDDPGGFMRVVLERVKEK